MGKELADYIPQYPSLSSSSNHFEFDIYRKKEFYQLRDRDVGGKESLSLSGSSSSSSYFFHQRIIARYLSNWTSYQGLLIVHETGTGKSGVASAVFDGLKQFHPPLKCLYLSSNETLLENFRKEIFQRSRFLQDVIRNMSSSFRRKWMVLLKEDDSDLSPEDRDRVRGLRNQILRDNGLTFKTYYQWSKEIQSTKQSDLIAQWNNQLLLFDEAHHLVSGGGGGGGGGSNDIQMEKIAAKKSSSSSSFLSDIYQSLYQFVHHLPMKRLLLLTATPMRNSPEELAPLLSLLLCPRTFLRTTNSSSVMSSSMEEFRKEFFQSAPTSSGVALYSWKSSERQKKFCDEVRGHISYLRQQTPVSIRYEGHRFSPMHYYSLEAVEMGTVQAQGYNRAYQADTASSTTTTSSFYSQSQQASLFVCPDAVHYGSNIPSSLFQKNQFTSLFEQQSGMKPFRSKSYSQYTAQDMDHLRHNLSCLRPLSCIYYSIIRKLLMHPREKQFVYCDKIHGSGIRLCIQLLRQYFGYGVLQRATNLREKSERMTPRLLFLHETIDITQRDIPLLIDAFNHPQWNSNAQLAQVVFGTDKTREGISLKQILHIHITTPDWNFGKIFQAIGRGIRATSHEGMSLTTTISISLYCSLLPKSISSACSSFLFAHNASSSLSSTPVITLAEQEKKTQMREEEEEERLYTTSLLKSVQEEKEKRIVSVSPSSSSSSSSPRRTQSILAFTIPPAFWGSSLHISSEKIVDASQLQSSIDFFQYYRSELKDRNIKLVAFELLRSSFDCELHRARNQLPSTPENENRAACFYQPCRYTCHGIPAAVDPILSSSLPLDITTYDPFYVEETLPETASFISSLFYHTTFHTFQEIESSCREATYSETISLATLSQLMDACLLLIDTPIPIPFHDGRKMYLQSLDLTFFFLTDAKRPLSESPSDLWMAEYAQRPVLLPDSSVLLPSLLSQMQENHFSSICHELRSIHHELSVSSTNKKEKTDRARDVFHSLIPLPFQLELLRQTILSLSDSSFSKWLISLILVVQPPLSSSSSLVTSSFVFTYFDPRSRTHWIFDASTSQWSSATTTTTTTRADRTSPLPSTLASSDGNGGGITVLKGSPSEEWIRKNRYGFYGIVEGGKRKTTITSSDGKSAFKLRDISKFQKFTSKKTTTSGKDCLSYDFAHLLYFLYRLDPHWSPSSSSSSSFSLAPAIIVASTKKKSSVLENIRITPNKEQEYQSILRSKYPMFCTLLGRPLQVLEMEFLLRTGSYFHHAKKKLCHVLQIILSEKKMLFSGEEN